MKKETEISYLEKHFAQFIGLDEREQLQNNEK
jgi:hypothetical protein